MRNPLLSFALLAIATAAPSQSVGIQFTTGIDGGVDLPADPRFVPTTGLTVEAWITYDDSTVPMGNFYWPTIARQNLTPNAESWSLRVNANNNAQRYLAFILRRGGGLYTINYQFQPGEFLLPTHIAACYTGNAAIIYKNGVAVSAQSLPTTIPLVYNGGTTRIGNGDQSTPGAETWNGMIDELRIWPMARTADEIQASMNQTLGGMHGGVLNFPLDGFAFEVNTGMQGVEFGTYSYVPGAPNITFSSCPNFLVAPGTTTCPTPADTMLGSTAEVGNDAFAIWGIGGPTPGNSPLGLLIAATVLAPATQPTFAGVLLGFEINSVAAVGALGPASSLGNTRFGLPIPNNPGLNGVSLIMQHGYADAQCGPQGFSSSAALQFTIQ